MECDVGTVTSSVTQPQMSFGGKELYPSIVAKATALCFSLVRNHPFVDGNKRIGHAAMETFLFLNGWELSAGVDDAENVIVKLAAGDVSRQELLDWIAANIREVEA
ncbi:MAG: type II toxin-antitoxin system death-on-curing family toxin [Pirellulales bacterium]